MRRRVSRDWMEDREVEVRTNTFVSTTTGYNPAAQWLISYLDAEGIPVKVINLGAGVKKIIKAENVCPHCGGKGHLK